MDSNLWFPTGKTETLPRGTSSSNPALSSGQSNANPIFYKYVGQFTQRSGWRAYL